MTRKRRALFVKQYFVEEPHLVRLNVALVGRAVGDTEMCLICDAVIQYFVQELHLVRLNVALVGCTAGDTETCLLCETVIQYLEALVENNATVEEIEQVLDKICGFLPATMKDQVGTTVHDVEYLGSLLDVLQSFFHASCQHIAACGTAIHMALITELECLPLSDTLDVWNL